MNELDLYKLFKTIISKSKSMKRFVVAPGYGNELNKNNLGEILEDIVGGITDGTKYPLCIMFPPIEIPNYDTGWHRYKCKLYFLKPQKDDKNASNVSSFNNLSKRTIQETWKDMNVAAIDFRKVFMEVTEAAMMNSIRDGQEVDVIDRVSGVANDSLAGVGVSFDVEINFGCEIADYDSESVNDIISEYDN